MQSRSRHWTTIAILLFAVLFLAHAAWGTARAGGRVGASSPAGRCGRSFSTTLVETGKVRIYAMAEGSVKHVRPTIAGRPVFGCIKATGESRLLDLPEVPNEQRAMWVAVGDGVFGVSGQLVAYAYTRYYFDSHGTWSQVRSMRTGTIFRSCWVGVALAPKTEPQIEHISVSPSSKVWWSAEGGARGLEEEPAPGCHPRD